METVFGIPLEGRATSPVVHSVRPERPALSGPAVSDVVSTLTSSKGGISTATPEIFEMAISVCERVRDGLLAALERGGEAPLAIRPHLIQLIEESTVMFLSPLITGRGQSEISGALSTVLQTGKGFPRIKEFKTCLTRWPATSDRSPTDKDVTRRFVYGGICLLLLSPRLMHDDQRLPEYLDTVVSIADFASHKHAEASCAKPTDTVRHFWLAVRQSGSVAKLYLEALRGQGTSHSIETLDDAFNSLNQRISIAAGVPHTSPRVVNGQTRRGAEQSEPVALHQGQANNARHVEPPDVQTRQEPIGQNTTKNASEQIDGPRSHVGLTHSTPAGRQVAAHQRHSERTVRTMALPVGFV